METIKQEDFLQEYFKDKEDWELQKKRYDVYKEFARHGAVKGNIDIQLFTNGKNILVLQAMDFTRPFREIFHFDVPETYEDFKTIMDILLKDN